MTRPRELYRSIMNSDFNALRELPRAQRFQIMVYLSVMWTVIFSSAAGAWLWFGELVLGHVLVALGLTVTGWTFGQAGRVKRTYRDHPRRDGTARYDDVWGA